MGRKSTKENKTIYQRYREQNDLTREKAAEHLDTVSADRIERIENEKLLPDQEDVIRMAECYKAPDLCNFYCSHQCTIGTKYLPAVEMCELRKSIMQSVSDLNALTSATIRYIEISRDGQISDDEIPDFASIQEHLEDVSLAVDSLHLWVEKTLAEGKINMELLEQYQNE